MLRIREDFLLVQVNVFLKKLIVWYIFFLTMFFLSVLSPALLQLEHQLGKEAGKQGKIVFLFLFLELYIAIWQVSQ